MAQASEYKPVIQDVQSRFGMLRVIDGYPTDETVAKLFAEIDFQRACQAFIWALPAVGFHGLHLAHSNTFGANDGEMVLYKTLQDKAGMLTPNMTTLYLMSFWDLGKAGPLVVDVPAGLTAGGVLDIWQRNVCDMGQTGPDKGKGGKYLLIGPEEKEMEAEGYIVIRSTSNKIWFATRGLSPDEAEAEALVRKHNLYAWKDRAKPAQSPVKPVGGKPWVSAQPVSLDYWQFLSDVLQGEPIDPRDRFFLAMLSPLGIEQGRPFAPTEAQKATLEEAAQVGELMARINATDKRLPGAVVWPGVEWQYANMVELDQEGEKFAQLDERASWFYEAIANSAGMQGRTLGVGQAYLETSKDKDGGWLSGGKKYRLHVPPKVPARQFWSITLYDVTTRGPVISASGSADISSRTEGLEVNADGSVDIYTGPTKPAGSNKNWIQTNPGTGWFPYFRFYGPEQPYFDKSWSLPDFERLQD